ncbi:MAG TPA: hypothetical protein VK867_04700 [Candidatus Limnocylindrales bacterium]|nr:hypothetical protein [Candidatus Limnocylindrales bacterium]
MTGRTAVSRISPFFAVVPLLIGACGGGATPPAADAPVIVTFEVVDERYKVLLTEPADIDTARRLLAGEDVPSIPNGRIVRETGVNEGYGWSIDPNDIEFGDVTIEVCDGLPSDVEMGIVTGDRYCPWSAVVLGVEPAG